MVTFFFFVDHRMQTNSLLLLTFPLASSLEKKIAKYKNTNDNQIRKLGAIKNQFLLRFIIIDDHEDEEL